MNTSAPATVEALSQLFYERLNLIVDSPDDDLLESGLIDSLMLVDLMFQLEQEYGVTIDVLSLDFEELRSLRSIAAYVERER